MSDSPEVAVARFAARISLWALGVAGGSLAVTVALLALEVRRWFDEGVRLSMSVMVDAKFFGGPVRDDETYIAVTVTNRGDAPTTLTHFVLYSYPSRLAHLLPARPPFLVRRWKSQWPKTFIVNTSIQPLPHVLEPGRNWHGMAVHTAELEKMIEGGNLFVGAIGSHSGRTLFKRARRWTPPKDSKPA